MALAQVRLDWLIVCTAAPDQDGAWSISCVVQQLKVPALPHRHRRFAVAAQIQNWDRHDDEPTAFITGPDERTLPVAAPSVVRVAGEAHRADTAAFVFDDVTFSSPGTHKATIVIEGVPFASAPFHVELCRG